MDTRKRMKMYEDLVNLNGISGFEKNVRKYVRNEISKYTTNIIQDRLGSIFGVLEGDGPTIMLAGHMDEVGAMVVGITEKGFIRMIPIGGVNPEVFLSQNMEITIDDNTTIKGIIGSTPPHINRNSNEAAKPITFDDLLLDIGADNKEHAISMGVKIGQQITPVNNYYVTKDGKKIVSKAWDDRFGCGMALEILKEVSTMKHPNRLVIGCTVQEEVGLRGAETASKMVKPDLFLALDVSPVGDFLDNNNPRKFGALGEGFLVRFYDPRCIMNEQLRNYFYEVANKNNIKYQNFLSMGGTDAASAQYAGNGVLATTIGLPGRYIHSTAAMIHVDDVEAVKKMALEIIKDFDSKRLEELLNA